MDREEQPVEDLSGDDARRAVERERDAQLLVRIRRNEARALRQFIARFEPILLDQARRLGVRRNERPTTVTDFLADILVKLARSPAPRLLASFVITSFRNCVADTYREALIRERHALAEEIVGEERVIRSGCSEFMVRAAEGPDALDDEPSSQSGTALIHILFDGCTAEERQLLVWSAHRVPLRDCATWLGISYDSVKQRLSRLRARLIHESTAHLSELSASDRANLTRRLNSAGVKTNNEPTRGSAA